MFDTPTLLVTGFAFLLAGFVKGTLGLGLPTVAIGVLSLAMPPAQAAALYVAPSLVTNFWQSLAGPNLVGLLRRLLWFFVTVCCGIWASADLLTGDTRGHAVLALGIALALYAAAGLATVPFRVPRRWESWASPIVGLVTGLITGATGVFVIPAVPYLQALDIEREELIQALGLSFLISTVVLAFVLAHAGILGASLAGLSLLGILPALAGMVLGQRLRGRIPAPVFRVCFFLGMLGLGLHLASRSLL
ncbi:MAG TPA: sulfite exporter TauE/SafE family protein [Woeseiaceae bacterium]|nr:sulfite exporter TauE/SafE family protein [Woeseiaceae bacterium]